MKFYVKKLALLAASFAAIAVMTPSLAAAHGDSHDSDDFDREEKTGLIRELGTRIFSEDDNDEEEENDNRGVKRGHDTHVEGSISVNGTVTAVSDSGFTLTANSGAEFTVDITNAKLVRLPRSVIVLGDIAVGDRVFVTGTEEDGTLTASVVFAKPDRANKGSVRALAKGTITAIDGTTLTVQGKHGTEATVTTDSNTEITKDGEAGVFADLEVGTKVKILGLWDSILHIFSALRIAIK